MMRPTITNVRTHLQTLQSEYDEREALIQKLTKKPCTWSEEDEGSLCYSTTCNQSFRLDEGNDEGLISIGFEYCCFCGGPLIEERYKRDDDDDETE